MADFITCSINHRQISHTYGTMRIDMHPVSTIYNTTCNCYSSTSVFPCPSFIYHFLPLLPDLRHVNLIPGNLEDTPTRISPTPAHQLESSQTGTILPPVPTSLVEKIKSGAFIEMGDLIPTRLGLDDTARSKLRRTITNISEWLQAFAVYVSIIAKKQPYRVPDLMGYQILILEASNEYRNDYWSGYDRRFQQQAASQPHCKWSDMDSTLWNMAFTGQARTGRCGYCFSLFHPSKDCELATDRGGAVEPGNLRSSRTVSRPHRLICRHWNEECTPNCSFPNCRYEHICSLCTFNPDASDIYHKAVYCPYRLNQSRSGPSTTRQRQPTPLFS